MKRLTVPVTIFVLLASAVGGVFMLSQEKKVIVDNTAALAPIEAGSTPTIKPIAEATSTPEELIAKAQTVITQTQKFLEQEQEKSASMKDAKERSERIRGIYVGSARNFTPFMDLLDQTQLNGLVIDIKESYGANLSSSLKKSVFQLHEKNVWAIARIVVFRDNSLIKEKPEWYLAFASTTDAATTNVIWRDKAGQSWLDPANEQVRDYIIEFSKKAIDYGFDELQFDYIRYPDDYRATSTDKVKVIGDFFSVLSKSLKEYRPSIILSVDLFGYVATQFNSYTIGQRLADAEKYFDYLSFMLYPSHFYGGLAAGAGWPYLAYPDVVEHPYDVVYRSLAAAGFPKKNRPWLQDFNLKVDSDRGVVYDAEKVKAQIQAAEDAGAPGWLLWNPSYTYTKEAILNNF